MHPAAAEVLARMPFGSLVEIVAWLGFVSSIVVVAVLVRGVLEERAVANGHRWRSGHTDLATDVVLAEDDGPTPSRRVA